MKNLWKILGINITRYDNLCAVRKMIEVQGLGKETLTY